ncbi:MAG: gamma-glutamyl-gamma-aminobutyrate hydrolase family protein [Patescibacteria group bacterium]|jgi:anthranilate/para-aminobenzoate synthase component II
MKKIKSLLIDNGSESIDKYADVFNMCDITTVDLSKLGETDTSKFQLIILSDGHLISAYKNTAELNLVATAHVPIIGICYGFQILGVAYGAQLEKSDGMIEGMHNINTKTNHALFCDKTCFTVYEKHRYSIKKIPNDSKIKCLADSTNGCEIIEIKGRNFFGFQFHPEITADNNEGSIILENLLNHLFAE